MDASAAARDTEPSVRARPRFMPGDLQLALVILGFCVFDAGANLVVEILIERSVPTNRSDGLARLFQLLLLSLLCIGPGALVARVAFRRFPKTHRDCLQLVALFIVGSTIGHWVGFHIVHWSLKGGVLPPWPVYVQSVLSFVPGATGVVYAMCWWRRDIAIQQELHRTQVGLLALKTDRADAELLRLRAQIEPHFLFNTLATIVQLYRSDTESADRTLALLIDYMNASRTHMRQQETLLGQELALAEGFLAIQQLRMGERLRHAIDVPPEIRGTRIPPASLLTLIENAVKHGIAPMAGGGLLQVAAHRDGGWLVLSVSDNGAGFRATSGRGLGLANLRARLQGLYGDGTSLHLTSADAGGVVATMRLPFGPPADAVA